MWVKYEYADAKRIKGATERHKPVKRVIQQTILNCAAERIANLDAEEAISMISGRPPSRVESTVQAWFVDSLGAITVATDSNDDALWNARESLYSAEWRQHSGGNVPFDRASTEACRVATEAFGK